jgi:hypothetical protein
MENKDGRRTLEEKWLPEILEKIKSLANTLRGLIYGLTVHELELEVRREKARLDNLLMLYTFGELIGLPILPPYYSLRLFPYFLPSMEAWKRRLLREKDLTDLASQDL